MTSQKATIHEEGNSSFALAYTNDSRHLVIAIADPPNHHCKLEVCDSKTLEVLWKQEGYDPDEPAIFTSPDAVCIAALDQLFTIQGPHAIHIQPLRSKPNALSIDNQLAFYSATPESRYASERGPSIFVREGGIAIRDVRRERQISFLSLEGKPRDYCFPLRYVCSSRTSRGQLVSLLIDKENNIEAYILINLDTYTYMKLPQSGLWSISDDGSAVARCWNWGVAAWKISG